MMAFAIHQHESATDIHVPPHPEPLFHLGCLRAPALGALLHAANLHWSYSLYMVNFYDIGLSSLEKASLQY